METLRLRRIQEPSRVARLFDAFVARAGHLPADAYQIRDSRQLPQSLRKVIARATVQGETWSCWARGAQIWLFTCEMSLALSRERGVPVILVRAYGEDAELQDSGTWKYDPPQGSWTRCAD